MSGFLKESIYLHYDSKHVIHRSVTPLLLTIWTNSNRRWGTCLIWVLHSGYWNTSLPVSSVLSFKSSIAFSHCYRGCRAQRREMSSFGQSSVFNRVPDHGWVLLCLASLMKPWFPKLPLCMFLLSSFCPKSLCLSQCQELPFGFVCRVLRVNWTNKLTD